MGGKSCFITSGAFGTLYCAGDRYRTMEGKHFKHISTGTHSRGRGGEGEDHLKFNKLF